AGSVGVNEMHLHGKALAGNQMLARMMEMELHQAVIGTAVSQYTGLAHVELDGMAVVDDGLRPLVPDEAQGSELRADHLTHIDRRLLEPHRAGAVGGAEVAPIGRTIASLVAPMDVRGARSP